MLDKCPGLYCGRTYIEANSSWSDCGACPRGFHVNNGNYHGQLFACVPCDDNPTLYDWLYLGFMALMPLILHFYFIDMATKQRMFSKNVLILHLSAFLEILVAAVTSMWIFSDSWNPISIKSCPVERLSDWYTVFHNPSPNYEDKLHCSIEAVYPLQTIVLAFYFLSLVLMMLVRPWLNMYVLKSAKPALYSALYFLPVLSLVHCLFCGLIYNMFPYLSIIISMISNAFFLAIRLDQTMLSLIIVCTLDLKNAIIILGHWLVLAYGIIALQYHIALLLLVPLPALFYVGTVKFTDPDEFTQDKGRRIN